MSLFDKILSIFLFYTKLIESVVGSTSRLEQSEVIERTHFKISIFSKGFFLLSWQTLLTFSQMEQQLQATEVKLMSGDP